MPEKVELLREQGGLTQALPEPFFLEEREEP